MKVDDFGLQGNAQIDLPDLPEGFARGVIVKARAVERRRKIGSRIAAVALLFAAAIPLGSRIVSRPQDLAARQALAPEQLALYQDNDQADALRLAETTNPDAVSDYLLPNTATLTQFASSDSDASWDYDSDWSSNSDGSTGS
jgi:hypothetical protein